MTQDRLLPKADLLLNPDSGDASYLVSALALAAFLDPELWTQRISGHEGNRLSLPSARVLEGCRVTEVREKAVKDNCDTSPRERTIEDLGSCHSFSEPGSPFPYSHIRG